MLRPGSMLLIGLLWHGPAMVAATAEPTRTNVVWFPEMPTSIYSLFRAAIETIPRSDAVARPTSSPNEPSELFQPRASAIAQTNWAAVIPRQLQTLESLRQIPWPALDDLQRIRFRRSRQSSNDTNSFETAWLIAVEPRALVILDDRFRVSQFHTNWFTRWESHDFREELSGVLDYLASTNADAGRSWPYSSLRYWHGQQPQYIPDLVRLAYCAASLGHTNQGERLARLALKNDRSGQFFELMAINAAAEAYDESMRIFDSVAARSEVLAAWERLVKTFPQSPLCSQMTNYLPVLRGQLTDFPRIAQSTVENPARLPPADRARYYLARFPDIPRRAVYSLSSESESQYDGLLLQLGPAAIPVLIEHLDDRRLTRQTTTPYGRPRWVLRVQDLALKCLEHIAQVRFYTRGYRALFSEEPDEARAKLAGDIRAWWNKHGDKEPLTGQLAQLENLPLYERLATLDRLAHEHASGIDSLGLLRRWAGETNQADSRWLLAEPLARLGDLSLLPLLRERVERGHGSHDPALLRYGGIDDYVVLRRAQWRDLAPNAFPFPPRTSSLLISDSELDPRPAPARNPWIRVPLLVDLLEHRQLSSLRRATASGPWSKADTAMLELTRLTGFSGGYQTNAPVWDRFAAMDRWLEWWDTEGRARFMAEHPETAPLFIESTVTTQTLGTMTLPDWIPVCSANRAAPVVYDAPNPDLPKLLESGSVRGKRFGAVSRFWFASSKSEERWFAKLTATPPGPTAKSPSRPPAMRVAIQGGAWPDSADRVWTCWQSESAWPAVYDGKRWEPSTGTDLPPQSPGYGGFAAAATGLRGAMFFLDPEQNVYLRDNDGWIESHGRLGLLPETPDRAGRSLPFPPVYSATGPYAQVKDGANNLWMIDSDTGLVALHEDRRSGIVWPDKSGVRLTRENLFILVPLGTAAKVLAVHGSGQAATFTLRNGALVQLTEFALPISLRPQTIPFRDHRGWTWLGGGTNSLALDEEGKIACQLPGHALCEDKRKGVWLIQNDGWRGGTLRRWTGNQEPASLRLPALAQGGALAPDQTIWLLAPPNRLLRVGEDNARLALLEAWDVSAGSDARVWCNEAGQVWICGPDRQGQLICYPMRRKTSRP